MAQGLSGRVDLTRLNVDQLIDLYDTIFILQSTYDAGIQRAAQDGPEGRFLFNLYWREWKDHQRLRARIARETLKRKPVTDRQHAHAVRMSLDTHIQTRRGAA